MQPGRLLIVRNPGARRAPSEAALEEGAAPLRRAGWEVELRSTETAGHATAIAAEAAAAGVDVVVAAGGDGTVHEVVNGLAGSESALAVVPAGTANVWAKESGTPGNVARALAWIATARRAPIDLGRVAATGAPERCFLLMCSAGFDAEVVRRVGEGTWRKRRLGRAWYMAAGVALGLRARPTAARIAVDGVELERELLFLVAGNTRLYGGLVRLTDAALADDGLLDVCVFSGRGLWGHMRLLARGLRGGLHRRAGGDIDYVRGAEVRIDAARPLAVQADGELVGETPATLSVVPRALSVLLAPGPNPLLRAERG